MSKFTKFLIKYNVDAIGGVQITLPRNNTTIEKAVTTALSHPFGIGSGHYRTGHIEKPTEADTVPFTCYKREVFDKIGLFNEKLVHTQDMEFNLRLKKAGGKILLIPEIAGYYYPRSDFKSFCKNNFKNGFWAIYPFKFANIMPVSLRHLIPLTFVSSLIGSGMLSFFFSFFLWLFSFIVGLYVLTGIYFSSKIAIQKKDIKYLFIMPVMFASLHITYGLGSIWGLLKASASKQFWENLRTVFFKK